MNWFLLVLTVLAAARITHLLADDYILSRPRDWYFTATTRYPRLNYLATCTWCVSIWVSGAAILLLHNEIGFIGWEAWVAWPATSYTVVFLESVIEYLYDDGDG